MDYGRMIRHMDTDNILILMEHNMKVIGSMINSMELAKNTGQMVHSMRETISLVKKMVMDNSCGMINHLIVVILLIITFMVMEDIDGLTEENIVVIGNATKCMDKVSSLGLMAEDTKDSIMTIRNKDMVFSPGQMEDNMIAIG